MKVPQHGHYYLLWRFLWPIYLEAVKPSLNISDRDFKHQSYLDRFFHKYLS